MPGEFAGPGPRPRVAQQGLRRVPQVREEGARAAADDAGAVRVRRHRARRGRPATTSTSRSARATCRPRRCSSPSPTRRSSTAARSSRPHLGKAVEDGNGVLARRRSARRSGAACKIESALPQAILTGLRGAATGAGGTSADVFAGSPYRNLVYGKTGTAERQPNPDQSWYACYVADPARADRGRRRRSSGRLRRGDCGTRGAPDPLRVVRCPRPRVPRGDSATRDEPAPDPAGVRAAAPARPARVASAAGPAAAAGHARAGRLLAGRAQRRDAGRRPRPPALLRHTARRSTPPSGSC